MRLKLAKRMSLKLAKRMSLKLAKVLTLTGKIDRITRGR